ncbi:MAG: preprotein translocase subunit SecE [Pseudomonadota bacterium]
MAVNPFQFAQEVRQETSKVTWPTRKETWVTTVAVLIMVALACVFFLITDQILGYLVTLALNAAR